MANLPNELDENIAQRLKAGKGKANDFYFLGYVDDTKTNKANLVQMSRAGKAQELLDIKRYDGGNKNETTYQCYVVY